MAGVSSFSGEPRLWLNGVELVGTVEPPEWIINEGDRITMPGVDGQPHEVTVVGLHRSDDWGVFRITADEGIRVMDDMVWIGGVPVDQLPADLSPNTCWRCDAAEGAAPLGLCAACRHALTA